MMDGTDPDKTSAVKGSDAGTAGPLRRRGRRKKLFKSARLVMGGGLSTIDCIVKDISVGGARVKVSDLTRPGRTLKLVFPDGEVLEAEVVRDHGVEFGLKFPPGTRPSLAPEANVVEDVLADLESPWLETVLQRLDKSEVGGQSDIKEAADDLRTACTHLKMLLERQLKRY